MHWINVHIPVVLAQRFVQTLQSICNGGGIHNKSLIILRKCRSCIKMNYDLLYTRLTWPRTEAGAGGGVWTPRWARRQRWGDRQEQLWGHLQWIGNGGGCLSVCKWWHTCIQHNITWHSIVGVCRLLNCNGVYRTLTACIGEDPYYTVKGVDNVGARVKPPQILASYTRCGGMSGRGHCSCQ